MYQGGGLLRDQRGWHPGGVSAIGKIFIVGRGKLRESASYRAGSIGEPLW